MVTIQVELFHEAIEDKLKHEPDKRTQAVAVRLRNLEVEAHRRFTVNEIANAGSRNVRRSFARSDRRTASSG